MSSFEKKSNLEIPQAGKKTEIKKGNQKETQRLLGVLGNAKENVFKVFKERQQHPDGTEEYGPQDTQLLEWRMLLMEDPGSPKVNKLKSALVKKRSDAEIQGRERDGESFSPEQKLDIIERVREELTQEENFYSNVGTEEHVKKERAFVSQAKKVKRMFPRFLKLRNALFESRVNTNGGIRLTMDSVLKDGVGNDEEREYYWDCWRRA